VSNARIFSIRERRVSDFIVVEHGSMSVTLSIFEGGEHKSLLISPEQAEAIARELIERAALVRAREPEPK